MIITASDVVRVSPGLSGADASARLAPADPHDALGGFAADGSADISVTMEVWTALREAPTARRVRVYLQRVPENEVPKAVGGATAGVTAGETAGTGGAGGARGETAGGAPAPEPAPETVAVLHLLESDTLSVVCHLLSQRPAASDAAAVGTGQCLPRHRLSFNSMNEASNACDDVASI